MPLFLCTVFTCVSVRPSAHPWVHWSREQIPAGPRLPPPAKHDTSREFIAAPFLVQFAPADESILVLFFPERNDLFCFAVFAMLGMLSPASRGALMTAAIFLFVFMGYELFLRCDKFLGRTVNGQPYGVMCVLSPLSLLKIDQTQMLTNKTVFG